MKPFEEIEGEGRLLLLCDHASNAMPEGYGTLGLGAEALSRHIAYDIGAAAVTRALAKALNAPAILGRYSRLFIDLNRGADDPTLVMRLSDGDVIPGNATIDEQEVARRTQLAHAPYHAAISARLEGMDDVPVIFSIHSFTPEFKGHKRPWECAVLWDKDPRFAVPLMEALRAEGLTVGDNEPYHGALKNDCLYQHGTANGFPHALIEIRQDLIGDEAGQAKWAARLARLLPPLLENKNLGHVQHYGSKTEFQN